MFAIQFLPDDQSEFVDEPGHRYGRVHLGDHVETFLAPLSYWAEVDYCRQWHTALRRLRDGASSTCLVTSMTDPKESTFVSWWALYRNGDSIVCQEQIHFLTDTPPFDPDDPYRSVPPRVSMSDVGTPISEWSVEAASIFAAIDDMRED